MKYKKVYLAIDPGTKHCGYAVLSQDLKLIYYGVISPKKKFWLENCKEVWFQLDQIILKYFPERVILEYPEYHSSEAAFAARESGSIFKLTFLCGGIYSTVMEYSQIQLVTPSQWKGQLKKEITKKRLMKIYPEVKEISDHNTVDAIGVGYYTIKKNRQK